MIARILFALTLTASTAVAQSAAPTTPQWLRYPAISPDGRTIVFTYKGDLYRVPSSGGSATPLTSHTAHDFMPVWSRDGRTIAFASDRYGNFDVYAMPADGGEARRLTFHSASEYPYAYAADGRSVLFGASRLDAASNRLYPTGSQPELYSVALTGGRPVQVLTTPAEDVNVSRNGQFFLYHDKKGENTWRKHQTSAIARDIWLYDTKAGTHKQLTETAAEDRNPIFDDTERAFYYLSEESGSFNVHRRNLDGGKSEQLTRFKDHPVRFLSRAGDGTLAFSYDGELYTMKNGAAPQKVAVAMSIDARSNNERVMAVNGQARELSVSPSGKEVAFTFRGDVFVTSVDGGVTKRITNTPEQETGVEFSPDSKSLIYASERGGRWAIYEARRTRDAEQYFYASTVLRETPVIANDRQNYQPVYSPDGKEIAFIENQNNLRVYNIATKQSRTLLTDQHLFSNNPNHHFEWSPDSKWLLFDYSVPGIAPGEVGLVNADGKGQVVNLTQSGFNDSRARWAMGGKALLWFSNRDGLRAAAQSGGAQSDVYAMFLTQDAWDRFRLTKEEFALVKEAEDRAKGAPRDTTKRDTAKVVTAPLTFDIEGANDRKARLTIHSSSLGDALVSKDGETLYYLSRFERGLNLWTTNLRTRETKMLVTLNANSGNMDWDKDQKSIFLLADGSLSKIDPATARRDPITISGEMVVDNGAEREYMFDHVWRKTRDSFYAGGYHGVNWAALRPQYAKYVPHIGNNYEFSEMLSELLGELNVSHSGASLGTGQPTDDATAALGIFYDQSNPGPSVRIDEVVKGGPLDKDGMNVRAGMSIESIDGEPVTADRDLAQYLNRRAGKNVLLTIADGNSKRDIVVKPITLAEENRLLYTRWVKRNADEVDKTTNGELGYIHVPGMNDGAYRTTFEEVMGRYATRKGVVVDTRFNGGGDLVADLAMFLSGQRFFDYTTDTRSSGFEPNFRWTKPSVSIANEANYSDGHCYAFAVKELKLGPLVGMPVPGTCTFAGWATLQDGLRWGVPGLGVKETRTNKYLENMQTEPDVKVRNDFSLMSKGRDQQLEAAIAELRKLVTKPLIK